MQIGISTASYFNRLPIEDCVEDIGSHGVGTVELFLNSFCEYEADFAAMLRERADRAGVSVYSVHPMSTQFEPQLFSIHPRQRADAHKIFEKVLRSAQILGASTYVMHGAATLNGAAKNMELARIAPIFCDLSAMAADHGLTLALENVSWCLFYAPEFGLRLREATRDTMHFTLDIKQAIRSGHSPFAYIDAVGDRLVNVHLCDYEPTADGKMYWRMPGRGICDFSAIADALKARGYTGNAFVEVYSDMYKETDEIFTARAYCEDRMA